MALRCCMVIQNHSYPQAQPTASKPTSLSPKLLACFRVPILSALLFSIDINKIDESVMLSKITMYVDDKQLYISEYIKKCIVL